MTEVAHAPLFAPARWQQVRALADLLDELPADQRAAELTRIAAQDADLAEAASALLADIHSDTAPLWGAVERLMPAAEPAAPEQIGPFRVLERIGAGGMGVIYLAERRAADFTQRVALKLLDGGASRLARLASRERRVLAGLVHPNITAFIDAGTQDGRAWLAMEYVDGEQLLDYCARRDLDVRARVRLFDQVCAAVAHAHAQLVVHRDLKPGNVLVNAEGTVKLLDFGIALILDAGDELAPATRVFTPGYAAPEQLRGERVTTATDIYALGLLLYEVVAGRRLPVRESAGGDTEWTTAELARHATTAPSGGEAITRSDPRIITRLLRGDLGRIIAHALAPDPPQRYASVVLLREDLQRWLEHRPLTIGRPGFAYLATRFVRRHQAAVAIAVIALAALIGMSIVALWEAQQARQMAARADHARSFLADLFASADPFDIKTSGRNAADLLRDGAKRIDREFDDAPEMQAELRTTIASALDRIGEPAQARDLLVRSVEQLRAIHGTKSAQAGAALAALATAREDSGDLEGAHRDFSESYALLQGTGPAFAKARIDSVTGLAKLANLRGDHADAERMHQAVLRERTGSEGPESADIAMDLMNLAADALYGERYAQAETLAQRAHDMLERTLGPHHARSIYVDNVLGLAQGNVGHVDAGIATLRGASDLARSTLQPGAMMIGNIIGALGSVQLLAGDTEGAIASLKEARTLNDAAKNPRRALTATMLGIAQLRGGHTEALATLHDARAEMAAQKFSDMAFVTWGQAAYGAALAAHGELAEGERLAREARANLLASASAQSVRLGDIDLLLAEVLERKPALDEAHTLREEALTTFRRVYGTDHPRTRAAAPDAK